MKADDVSALVSFSLEDSRVAVNRHLRPIQPCLNSKHASSSLLALKAVAQRGFCNLSAIGKSELATTAAGFIFHSDPPLFKSSLIYMIHSSGIKLPFA